MRLSTFVLFAALSACATTSSGPKDVYFSRGPDLADAPAVSRWLETQQTRGALVRVPVTVTFDANFAITATAMGSTPLKVDTGALGAALTEKLRGGCEAPGACDLWLEGRWTAVNPLPTLALTSLVRFTLDGEKADYVEAAD